MYLPWGAVIWRIFITMRKLCESMPKLRRERYLDVKHDKAVMSKASLHVSVQVPIFTSFLIRNILFVAFY